jgi:hypothetical protein
MRLAALLVTAAASTLALLLGLGSQENAALLLGVVGFMAALLAPRMPVASAITNICVALALAMLSLHAYALGPLFVLAAVLALLARSRSAARLPVRRA